MLRLLAFGLAVTFAPALCAFTACEPDASPSPETVGPAADTLMLFSFDSADTAPWSIENDGVMGGRSQGFFDVTEGMLVFTGEVVTRGGGFTSVRAVQEFDLSGYDGIELRVRGGGRTFELDVDDGTRNRGREVNRQGPIPTSETWQTVRVPFATLTATAHGNPVRVAPLDLSALQSIGLYIADGIDGPFRLEVDWIRAYQQTD